MTQRQPGFTLVEVLIALVIFAIVGIVVTSGLALVLKARDRSKVQLQAMQQLQLALIMMQQDFSQLVVRPVSDTNGSQLPAFIERVNYLEFTRAGYLNPLMAFPRSTLQRVAYSFNNHQLSRQSWPVLDRAPSTQPATRVVLTNLAAISFSFLAATQHYSVVWPPGVSSQNQENTLPKGISVSFDLAKLGKLNYLFLIPASANEQAP